MSYEFDARLLESHTIHVPYADEPGLIPRDIAVNMVTFAEQKPSTLVAMGMGNEGRAPYMAQTNVAKDHDIYDLAYLEGLPYHQIAPNRVLRFGIDATRKASEYLAEHNGDQPTHLLPESQATPSSVIEFFENMNRYSRIDPLHPLGYVTLGRMAFFNCLRQTGMQRDQLRELFGPAGYVGCIAVKRGVQDLARGAKRLKVALTSDITAEWAQILRQRPDDAAVHVNDDCKLFPEDKVMDGMRDAYIVHDDVSQEDVRRMLGSVRSIPGSHSSPASKAGAAQVANVVSYARTKQAKDQPSSED